MADGGFPPAFLRPSWTVLLTASALFVSGFLSRGFLTPIKTNAIIDSPRKTLLPKLSEPEKNSLPYPLDALPGARDVRTPYGTIRVYEWGPEDGRKVLLVHGISTPCISLGAVAHGLAEQGCRVMLFDLFGRGYSDNPLGVPHDTRLFSSQILLVLATSPLSWTGKGSGRFSLIGYSLGAGIAMGFAAYFPELLSSVILIAPSGVIRPYHISRMSRVIYSEGVIPEPLLNRIVRKRLKTPLFPKKKIQEPSPQAKEKADIPDTVKAEINIEGNARVPLSKTHPNITVESAIHHQVDHHQGFVQALMSSVRHGPITGQQHDWETVGAMLTAQKKNGRPAWGFEQDKVLIILGEHDSVINKDEVSEDATAALDGNVDIKVIKNVGHEAPITNSSDVVRFVMEFWA